MRHIPTLFIFISFITSCEGAVSANGEPDTVKSSIDLGGDKKRETLTDMSNGTVPKIDEMSPDMSDKNDTSPEPPTVEERIPVVVAFGWKGLTSLSIDEGKTWCETGLMSDRHNDLFRGGAYHDGLFVGAHAGFKNRGAIITSTNGYEWTAHHSTNANPELPENPSGQWYGGVAYGNGKWVAGGGGCSQMASSTDGKSWAKIADLPACKPIRSMAFGNGRFVAGLDELGWWESVDGENWTQKDAGAGTTVVWNGSDFEGPINGKTYYRGRGVCLWGEGGGSTAKIVRSENADCSDPIDAGPVADKVMAIVFGEAPAKDFQAGAIPDELGTCLGL